MPFPSARRSSERGATYPVAQSVDGVVEMRSSVGWSPVFIEQCERAGHKIKRFRGAIAVAKIDRSPGRELSVIK